MLRVRCKALGLAESESSQACLGGRGRETSESHHRAGPGPLLIYVWGVSRWVEASEDPKWYTDLLLLERRGGGM